MIWILLLTVIFIVLLTAVWKIHPLPVLLSASMFFGICMGVPVVKIMEQLSNGFGNTLSGIGLPVIAGCVIGAFMGTRGALRVLADRILALTGVKRAHLAMGLIGYVVSICIFCDSAFVILIGLWKKIGTAARLPLAVGAAALALGLFSSHCFVPPTPGPLAALSLLSADWGWTILFGLIASAVAATAGMFYAVWAGRNEVLDQSDSQNATSETREMVFQRHWIIAVLPILIPLVLIALSSLVKVWGDLLPQGLNEFFIITGNPLAALWIGALLAVFGLGRWQSSELSSGGLMGSTIVDAANILVVTCAGGSFGEVLKNTDFVSCLPKDFSGGGVLLVLIAIAFSAILKTAQGSSTLAILTAAGMLVPILDALEMTGAAQRSLLCCAVCCGGMMVSHTNDSYFWVVTRFSGMDIRQGLKLQTLGSLVSGLAAAAVIVFMAFWVMR